MAQCPTDTTASVDQDGFCTSHGTECADYAQHVFEQAAIERRDRIAARLSDDDDRALWQRMTSDEAQEAVETDLSALLDHYESMGSILDPWDDAQVVADALASTLDATHPDVTAPEVRIGYVPGNGVETVTAACAITPGRGVLFTVGKDISYKSFAFGSQPGLPTALTAARTLDGLLTDTAQIAATVALNWPDPA